MVMENCFDGIYRGRKVFVSGVTGFKGSWLAAWLQMLGAEVTGISLDPPSTPNHFDLLRLQTTFEKADIRDYDKFESALINSQAEIVFHLAAQALVSESYLDPLGTFSTNIIGTANLLNACRRISTIKAIVVVTSDKCYEIKTGVRAFREEDPLSGYDPYSASKACAEIITSSFYRSFYQLDVPGHAAALIATARAGNVIGGGDWARDRLIPDLVRAASSGKPAVIRQPGAIRPWQHVLESLSGYLLLGSLLWKGGKNFAGPWNFGPDQAGNLSVSEILHLASSFWERCTYEILKTESFHETECLMLDNTKARRELSWQPVWDIQLALEKTMLWYRAAIEDQRIITTDQILEYTEAASEMHLNWIK